MMVQQEVILYSFIQQYHTLTEEIRNDKELDLVNEYIIRFVTLK